MWNFYFLNLNIHSLDCLYRRVARNQLIPKILYKYQPADNVIFLDPESEKPERMIFEIQGSYLEHEELHLAELNELISCHEVINSKF